MIDRHALCAVRFALFVGSFDNGVNAATHVKIGFDLHKSRRRSFHQIIQNPVGDGLMKSAFVAVAPKIKFQALELHAQFIGNILNPKHRKIRLAGFGTNAGEFRAFEADFIIALRAGIGENVEFLAGFRRHAAL